MLGPEELEKRFTYHAPGGTVELEAFQSIRNHAKMFAAYVDHVVPDSREKSLAITAIEEAVMWANAGIARNGGVRKS